MYNQKTRLHKYITQFVKKEGIEYTNHDIQKNIESYGVRVNSILIKKRLQWILPYDEISIKHWPVRETGDVDSIEIVKETNEYILLFKPYNLVVQPGAGHKKDNLITWLTSNYSEQKKMINTAPDDSNSKITAGLVHRIDKNTQGLLLVARSLDDLSFFQNQFRNRSVTKEYLTVVNGIVENNYEVSNWQVRDKKSPTRQKLFWTESEAKQYDEKARFAKSNIEPLFSSQACNKTILKITIHTGRTHQIRLQCEALGFPIVKDNVYNKGSKRKSHKNIDSTMSEGSPADINKEEFEKIYKKIGKGKEFCLVSNKIVIKTKNGKEVNKEFYKL